MKADYKDKSIGELEAILDAAKKDMNVKPSPKPPMNPSGARNSSTHEEEKKVVNDDLSHVDSGITR